MLPELREITHPVGALLPSLEAVLRNTSDGSPIDLANFSAVKFRMASIGDAVAKIDDAAAVFVDQTEGIVRYDWQSADVDTAGRFYAWFILEDIAGKQQFWPTGRKFIIEFVPVTGA